MNIILTFDYELFFGKKTGTANACIIAPTERLAEMFTTLDISVTFYVDVGYLLRCKALQKDMESYDAVIRQLIALHNSGHDLQLHIHPHWEDGLYIDGLWDLSATRYRLHQFSKAEVSDIIVRYSEEIKSITGIEPVAYRAGGWCIQPFSYYSDLLFLYGIRIDSTIFKKGKRIANTTGFDFTNAPDLTSWRFDSNPLEIVENGRYLELPISSFKVTPFFYWQLIWTRLCNKLLHRSYGDGTPISLSMKQVINLLTRNSHGVVSMDGYKSKLLEPAYLQYLKDFGIGAEMVFIGHPKAATRFSLQELETFISNHQYTDTFLTTREWYKQKRR